MSLLYAVMPVSLFWYFRALTQSCPSHRTGATNASWLFPRSIGEMSNIAPGRYFTPMKSVFRNRAVPLATNGSWKTGASLKRRAENYISPTLRSSNRTCGLRLPS